MELIMHFRERMKSLPIEVQTVASKTFNDLSFPCQMMVIWAKEPEFQIIVIAHLKEMEDKTIEIYGPIENSNLFDYIEKQVLNSNFVKLIGRDEVKNSLAHIFTWLLRNYNPLSPLRPGIFVKTRIRFDEPYSVGWLVVGNLLRCDIKELIDNCIKEIISTARPSFPASPPEEKVILEGFGAYVRPPIWIGEVPKPKSFREKVLGLPLWEYSSQRVVMDVYKGFPVIVLRNGYIAIGIKEKSKALEFLNEMMATLLLLGIQTHVIREVDLGEATFKEKSAQWSAPISPETWPYVSQFVINEVKVRNAIKLAELITTNERMKSLISLLHEAYTYFMNTEYKQALIMSWVILEDFYIEDLLSSTISKITSDKKRLEKIENWNIDQKIEVLNISHVISNEEYDLLMEIKKARNDVVHEGKAPGKEIVEKCLNLASRVVQKYIGTYFGELLPKLF
ncbi:MAG: hypothetical protein MRT15_11470 [archaeon YNP-LCB-003-016]|uniref:DUF4145 domain-containing protein n=1 Tax=Candidatus Culexarchaeum yellowstonense TaxID=2928963 RepID=UPI0026F36E39|nr:hypothetical protein [Candidatus Culexarchaeum yellowstonense]MCR6693003.1 hypothetical protein [Candidatus Culexarchaeum yellowstonense]